MKNLILMCVLFGSTMTLAQTASVAPPDRTSDAEKLRNAMDDYEHNHMLSHEQSQLKKGVNSLETCCTQNENNYYWQANQLKGRINKSQAELDRLNASRENFLKIEQKYNSFRNGTHGEKTKRFRAWLKAEKNSNTVQADVLYKLLPEHEKKLVDKYNENKYEYAHTVNTQDVLLADIGRTKRELKDLNERLSVEYTHIEAMNGEIAKIEADFQKLKSEHQKTQIRFSDSDLDYAVPCKSRKHFNVKGFDRNTILVKGIKHDVWGTPYDVYAFQRINPASYPTESEVISKCKFFPCESDNTPPAYGLLHLTACTMVESCNAKAVELYGDAEGKSKGLIDFEAYGNKNLSRFIGDEMARSKKYFNGTGEGSYFDLWVKFSKRTEMAKYTTEEGYEELKAFVNQYMSRLESDIAKITFDPKGTLKQNNDKILNLVKNAEKNMKSDKLYTGSKINADAKEYVLQMFFGRMKSDLDFTGYDAKKGKTNPERLRKTVMKMLDVDCTKPDALIDPELTACQKYLDLNKISKDLVTPTYEFKNEIQEKNTDGCPVDFVSRVYKGYFDEPCASCAGQIEQNKESQINDMKKVIDQVNE